MMKKLFNFILVFILSTLTVVVDAMLNTTIIPIVNLELPVAQGIQKIHVSLDDSGDIELKNLQFITTSYNTQYPDHETMIDIVVIKVPESCQGNDNFASCDWSTFAGVGVPTRRTGSGYTSSWYCCTKDARADKACTAEQYGHLIIDTRKFVGERRSLNITAVSSSSNTAGTAATPTTFETTGQESWFYADEAGDYAIILANCHVKSKTVKVNGNVTVESFEIKRTMAQVSIFHILLALCYIGLMIYYYQLMQLHYVTRIILEEWIMTIIILGLIEITLRAIEYHIWANSGQRAGGLAFFAMLFGAAKHALGRCLLLLLSLGWGVVRDSIVIKTLGAALFLSMALFLITISFDLLIFYESHHVSDDSDVDDGKRIMSLFMTLYRLQIFIEVIFMIWIPCALFSTMKYLKSTDAQHSAQKLARYRTLLRIVLLCAILTCLTIIIALTEAIPGITFMTLTETNQVNFFIILTFVAMVWKPNPYAREYAYSSLMDLSLEGGGDDEAADHHYANHNSNAANNAQSTMYMELTDSTQDVVAQHYPQQQQQQQSWMVQPQRQQFS